MTARGDREPAASPVSFALHPGYVCAQHGVHAGLVPRAARAEPVEHVLIDAQGDCSFRCGDYRGVVPEIRWQILQLRPRRSGDPGFGHALEPFEVDSAPVRLQRIRRPWLQRRFDVYGDYSSGLR